MRSRARTTPAASGSSWQLGELPPGYDHKYTYSHIGYNLKVTDMQAAVGVAQLEKLPAFIAARRRNFADLKRRPPDLEEYFILPEATPGSEPSWFGFPLAVRPGSRLTRKPSFQSLDRHSTFKRSAFRRQPAAASPPTPASSIASSATARTPTTS